MAATLGKLRWRLDLVPINADGEQTDRAATLGTLELDVPAGASDEDLAERCREALRDGLLA